jgi:hypothetical protein
MALADAVRYLAWGLRELTVGLRAKSDQTLTMTRAPH